MSHHVLLSIIGVDQTREYPHFLGKMAQESTGPERHDLVDMARRINHARGGVPLRLVPSWVESGFGVEMAGDVLLPHPGARIAATTFDEWLRTAVGTPG